MAKKKYIKIDRPYHKAFVIMPREKIIEEVTIGQHEDISTFGGFQYFDAVRADKDNYLYVDDEGAINGTKVGFVWNGQTYFGRGVILGVNNDNGESKDCTLTKEEIKKNIDAFFVIDSTEE